MIVWSNGGYEGGRLVNLPNRITLARICLIPFLMVFLLVDFPFYPEPLQLGSLSLPYNQLIAAVIFIIAASTDGIDGYLARKNNMVTNLGKLLDPLADKLLVTAVLISLVEMGKLDSWIAVVIISREFAVTGLRQIALLDGVGCCRKCLGQAEDCSADCGDCAVAVEQFPVFIHGYSCRYYRGMGSSAYYHLVGYRLLYQKQKSASFNKSIMVCS